MQELQARRPPKPLPAPQPKAPAAADACAPATPAPHPHPGPEVALAALAEQKPGSGVAGKRPRLTAAEILAAEELSPVLPGQVAPTQTEGCGAAGVPGAWAGEAGAAAMSAPNPAPTEEGRQQSAQAGGHTVLGEAFDTYARDFWPGGDGGRQAATAQAVGRSALAGSRMAVTAAAGGARSANGITAAAVGSGMSAPAAAAWAGWDWPASAGPAGLAAAARVMAGVSPRGPDTPPWTTSSGPAPASLSPAQEASAAPVLRPQPSTGAPSRLRWSGGQAPVQPPADALPGANGGGGSHQGGDPISFCVRAWLPHDLAVSEEYLAATFQAQSQVQAQSIAQVLDHPMHDTCMLQRGPVVLGGAWLCKMCCLLHSAWSSRRECRAGCGGHQGIGARGRPGLLQHGQVPACQVLDIIVYQSLLRPWCSTSVLLLRRSLSSLTTCFCPP